MSLKTGMATKPTNKITEYYIALSDDAADLEKQVKERLKSGWQLHGNPFIQRVMCDGKWYDYILQAMVK